MDNKVETEVVIGGKVYTLSGYESEEYLQKVASYLNARINELDTDPGYRRLPVDMQAILLDINIADDYFKQMNRTDLLKEESVGKEKDLYDLKHELISTQIRLQNAESSVRRLEKEKEEISRRALMLETELKSLKDRRDRH